MTPFYGVKAVQESIEAYVADINADPAILPSRGPFSKYVLPAERRQGTIELSWLTEGEDGIACNLTSEGAAALNAATEQVRSVRFVVSLQDLRDEHVYIRSMLRLCLFSNCDAASFWGHVKRIILAFAVTTWIVMQLQAFRVTKRRRRNA